MEALTEEEQEFMEQVGRKNLLEITDDEYKRYLDIKYNKILKDVVEYDTP